MYKQLASHTDQFFYNLILEMIDFLRDFYLENKLLILYALL